MKLWAKMSAKSQISGFFGTLNLSDPRLLSRESSVGTDGSRMVGQNEEENSIWPTLSDENSWSCGQLYEILVQKKIPPPRPSIFQILILEGPGGDFWTQWVQISNNQPSEPKITPHFSLWRPFSKIISQKIPPPPRPDFHFFSKNNSLMVKVGRNVFYRFSGALRTLETFVLSF